MINFRINRVRAVFSGSAPVLMLAICALTFDGYSNGLWAQSDADMPTSLFKPSQKLPKHRLETSVTPQETPTPVPKFRSGIEVNRLQRLDPQEFGTIDAASGGFARNMWDDTTVSMAAHLIEQLPDAIESRILRETLRRVLLTSALPPANDQQTVNLGVLRIAKLQTMGLLGSATALLDSAPKRNTDTALRRLHADTLLMRNDIAGACTIMRRPGTNFAVRFWQHLLIFCQVLENNVDEALLGVDLMTEGTEPIDQVFMLLVDGFISGNFSRVDVVGQPTPLLLAMICHAKLPIPAPVLDLVSPPLLPMIAKSPETDLDLRLEAAEKAVRLGAMTTHGLVSIYEEINKNAPFSGDELDNALRKAQAARSPRERAMLYQALSGQRVPMARAEILQKALNFAGEDGVYLESIQLYRAMLESMDSSNELSWFAADAARALLALGRPDLARNWVDELRYKSLRDLAFKDALGSLWVMANLAGAPNDLVVATGEFKDWRAAIAANSTDPLKRIKDGVALLDIAGHPVEVAHWGATLAGSKSAKVWLPDYAYRAALRRAAAAGRFAETVILSVIVSGGKELGGLDASVLADIVESLRTVGVTTESQAVILEAAVGKGV